MSGTQDTGRRTALTRVTLVFQILILGQKLDPDLGPRSEPRFCTQRTCISLYIPVCAQKTPYVPGGSCMYNCTQRRTLYALRGCLYVLKGSCMYSVDPDVLGGWMYSEDPVNPGPYGPILALGHMGAFPVSVPPNTSFGVSTPPQFLIFSWGPCRSIRVHWSQCRPDPCRCPVG